MWSIWLRFVLSSLNRLASIFENKDANKIIELLGFMTGEKLLAEKHLIIFDEVQEQFLSKQ